MEETENGVSFGKLCKVAVRRWKLLLIITTLVTVAGALLITLVVNKNNVNYSTTFNYVTKSLGQEKYVDGNDFSYKSIISKESLDYVKASKEEYSTIDVDSMLKNNDISISMKLEERATTSTDTKKTNATMMYTVTVKGKYFSSSLMAKNFISDLTSKPLKDDAKRLTDFVLNSSLLSFDTADTYEKQIKFLGSQASSLKDLYYTIIPDIESVEILDEINSNITYIDTTMNVNTMNYLTNRYLSEGFVKDYESLEFRTYETTIDALLFEKARNEETIKLLEAEVQLLGDSVSLSTLQELISLTMRNAEIDRLVTDMSLQIANKGNDDPVYIAKQKQFEDDLLEYRNILNTSSDKAKAILNKVYIKDATISYKDPNVLISFGGMNIAIAILLPLLIGFVGGCVVNLIVDRKLLHE